jgi:histidine triad (HIT) family protein
MDPNCTFCQIIAGDLPAKITYQDDRVVAFMDIHPAAPVHHLIVPREHFSNLSSISTDQSGLIGHMFMIAKQIARDQHIEKSGYRLIINNGPDANQTIFHLHLHLLGGNPMRYPMG